MKKRLKKIFMTTKFAVFLFFVIEHKTSKIK